jgi:hypothetical protein
MSGMGLTLDKEALQVKTRGRLFDLAADRGFTYVSSLVYNLPASINKEMPNQLGRQGAEESIQKFRQRHPKRQFEIEYISASGNFWILRIMGDG